MKLNPKPTASLDGGDLIISRLLSNQDQPQMAKQFCPFNPGDRCGIECPLLKITPNEIILGCASGVYWKREKWEEE